MPAEPTLRLRGGGADAKRKAARKRKFAQAEVAAPSSRTPEHQQSGAAEPKVADPSTSKQPSKKRKRTEEEPPQAASNNDSPAVPTSLEADDTEPPVAGQPTDAATAEPTKPQRFIVFIGNLPFTTTTASIRTHFAKVAPASIRHSTHKETGKSKGFAFLEFDRYDRMKTCLKMYHHSSFEDGVSVARKINVELTAGGGGAKSKDRREKLQTKNEKLNEERKRRALEEEKASRKAGREAGKGAAEGADVGAGVEDTGDVHPSRRTRVPKG